MVMTTFPTIDPATRVLVTLCVGINLSGCHPEEPL
jgi:hypothetical protein